MGYDLKTRDLAIELANNISGDKVSESKKK